MRAPLHATDTGAALFRALSSGPRDLATLPAAAYDAVPTAVAFGYAEYRPADRIALTFAGADYARRVLGARH